MILPLGVILEDSTKLSVLSVMEYWRIFNFGKTGKILKFIKLSKESTKLIQGNHYNKNY